ncbi:phage major capsid protein [Micromonospora sp. 4G57]|uniref:Phage major capsid protein n=1 Tax=Micromonospora sicca TaxID=2202420 RepID=A0ABU5JL36_9ACTN|nr:MULTISPECIES: phage major capsid protein [unclassified Micromonospora]MDZ5446602.1 phage major capsid protein [Micromonospora sp. 4G57]MDZ5493286.1 phage major capsid protein [Micromonospora sp. 4G53]
MTALDNVALHAKRAKLVNNLIQIADNPALSVEARNAAIDTLAPADAEQRTEVAPATVETRAAVEAEQRSAIAANPVGLPGARTEVRAGDLLSAEVRALTGASGMGAVFTPAEQAGYVLDFLAKSSVIIRSGVNVIRTSGDSIVIPHMTSDGTAGAIAEAGTIPLSDPNAEALTAVPRKFAQGTRVPNEILADSKPAALDQLSRSLIRSVGLAYDLSAFEGNGTAPALRGLKSVAGIGTFPVVANGAVLSNLDPIADALGLLAEANADDESAVIVMPPRTWRAILKLKEASGSNKSLIQDSAGSASNGVSRSLFGRPVFLSGNLALNEVEGTSGAVCNSIYVYVPSEVYAVVREDAVFDVNPYVYGATDETLVTAKMRADILVPNPAAVVRVTGVK